MTRYQVKRLDCWKCGHINRIVERWAWACTHCNAMNAGTGAEPLPTVPPAILCSRCGEPLEKLDRGDRRRHGFQCRPCGRTVAP